MRDRIVKRGSMTDDRLISFNAAIDALHTWFRDGFYEDKWWNSTHVLAAIEGLPSAQPPKEIPKRVLWTGWKGCRDTRYKCPNCEKPVRNDDTYCHRCGQRLLFPNVSFTDYVPGQGHELIVRWDDEG